MRPAGTEIEPETVLDARRGTGFQIRAPEQRAAVGEPVQVAVKRAVPPHAAKHAGAPERIVRFGIIFVRPFQTGIPMRQEQIALRSGRAHEAVGVAGNAISNPP